MILRIAVLLVAFGSTTRMSAQELRGQLNFADLPSDQEVSDWLMAISTTYRDAYDAILDRTYVDRIQFKSVRRDPLDFSEIGVFFVDRTVEIRISKQLTGAERVRTMTHEIFNTYLNEEHRQIDAAAAQGFLNAREFAVAHEIYEYEAWRIYHRCLVDVERQLGEGHLPAGLYYWTTAQQVRAYKLPPLFAYLKHMEESRHMNHYLEWFEKHYSQRQPQD